MNINKDKTITPFRLKNGEVIKYVKASFTVLVETHCMGNQIIDIDNYKVFQRDRPTTNQNAKRGSGGVA